MSAISGMEGRLKQSPAAYGFMLTALSYAEGACDITVMARQEDPNVEPMLNYIRSLFLPESQVIFAGDRARVRGESPETMPQLPTITICQRRVCGPPIRNVLGLQRALMVAR